MSNTVLGNSNGGTILCSLKYKDISFDEDFTSGERKYKLPYVVIGAASEDEAIEAVRADVAGTFGEDPESFSLDGSDGPFTMRISAVCKRTSSLSYGYQEAAPKEPLQITWDASGEKKRIFRAKELVGNTPGAPEILGIGYDEATGKYQGVEVLYPRQSETYKARMKVSELDADYKRTVCALIGKVNADKFMDWKPGEVLLLGANASWKTTDKFVDVSYRVAISTEETFPMKYTANGATAESTMDATKSGWSYVWYWLSKTPQAMEEDGVKSMRTLIKHTYIHRVYDAAKFAELKIS